MKLLGYLGPDEKMQKPFRRPRSMQEQHQPMICGACKFGDCVWKKESD